MTATQALDLYQITKRYFHKEDDARLFIQEIENIIEDKYEFAQGHFASKADVQKLYHQIEIAKAENKTDISILKGDLERKIFKPYFWIIPMVILFVTLLIIIIKV